MLRTAIRLFAMGILFYFVLSCTHQFNKPKEINVERVQTFILHVDEGFTKAEKDVVIDSFVEWERDTHKIVRFVLSTAKWNSKIDSTDSSVDDENGCTIDVFVARIESSNKFVQEFEKRHNTNNNTLGLTLRQCSAKHVAFVMDRIEAYKNPTLLRTVGVHEVGHVIGLDHIPVPNETVMFPSVDHVLSCPTALDMKQFCLLYGCDWHDMKSCSFKQAD